ncbi:hypothetical protein PHMEG_00023369, partial [Phytophthora megakarya]
PAVAGQGISRNVSIRAGSCATPSLLMMRPHHFTDCRYKQLFLALNLRPNDATKSKNLSNSAT